MQGFVAETAPCGQVVDDVRFIVGLETPPNFTGVTAVIFAALPLRGVEHHVVHVGKCTGCKPKLYRRA